MHLSRDATRVRTPPEGVQTLAAGGWSVHEYDEQQMLQSFATSLREARTDPFLQQHNVKNYSLGMPMTPGGS